MLASMTSRTLTCWLVWLPGLDRIQWLALCPRNGRHQGHSENQNPILVSISWPFIASDCLNLLTLECPKFLTLDRLRLPQFVHTWLLILAKFFYPWLPHIAIISLPLLTAYCLSLFPLYCFILAKFISLWVPQIASICSTLNCLRLFQLVSP